MKLKQFEAEEGRRKDDSNDRPWRRHAPAINKPPSNPDYPKKPFDYEEWMKRSQPKVEEDATEVPDIGDTIRTKKMQMEGVVTKLGQNRAGYDEVYFKVFDGRLMVTPLSNVTVIQKLADEENSMMEDRVDEVSTELLAKYKTAAGKSASDADKKGDYATGNKRFGGIVKATKKQFSNDSKKSAVSENSSVNLDIVWRKVEDVVSNIWPDGDPVDWLAPWAEKHGLNYSVFDDAAKKNGYNDVYEYFHSMGDLGEGSSGGINRSAPSNDVSYEKVLDRNSKNDHSEVVGEQQLDELSVGKLQAYKDAAKSPENFKKRPLRKLSKTVNGVQGANDRIKVKTGDKVGMHQPDRGTYESRLAEFLEIDELYRGPHHGDAEKLAKSPKSSMQGKGDVRFSDLVKDAVDTHGVKWAFDYYVKKHGLPPRQFQLFAGLTAEPKTVEPKKDDWTDPSRLSRPRPQSWWQKLRGKLPFEE